MDWKEIILLMGTFQESMSEYFLSSQPVWCLQQHWHTPKVQTSQWQQQSGDEPSLPECSTLEPITHFTLVNAHIDSRKRQGRTTTMLLGSQAQDSQRSLSFAGLEERRHSRAAAQDPLLHACSFKPLQVPQKPDGAELQHVQTTAARLSNPALNHTDGGPYQFLLTSKNPWRDWETLSSCTSITGTKYDPSFKQVATSVCVLTQTHFQFRERTAS